MRPGKLYVLENHLCFYSDFMGETKIIFSFSEIDDIKKIDSRVEVKVGLKVHKFNKFTDVQFAYQYIRTSWIGSCPEKDTGDTPDSTIEEVKKPSSLNNKINEEMKSVDAKLNLNTSKGSKSSSAKSVDQKIEDKVPKIQPILIPVDDPQMLEKSLVKYPKKENEFLRYIFPFSAEEYYNRFISSTATFNDVKLYEASGIFYAKLL